MNDRTISGLITLSIAAVERDTGLSKDTLRVWERRYGYPTPDRDAFGERIYSVEQVDKLRVIRRLMDVGHRPGRIIRLPIGELQAMATATATAPRSIGEANSEVADLRAFLEMIKGQRVDELRRALSQAQLRLGLERFVIDLVGPLNRAVGESWARGYLEVFEEHLYTESIQVILRAAIGNVPQPGRRPRVLLTTFPNEPHGLGLLMAEALLALEGARCVSLGVQTPIWDIVLAATSQHADVVGLTFSGVINPNQMLDGLAELRQKLPRATGIWAGGSAPVLQRKAPPGIEVFAGLGDLRPAVERWRNEHPER
ncbi:MAG: MerR family transcriptional regulator [Burkholderiales bacterium]|nr:MAG: MerR family transcriptional regulator [Burkholderiales bacterium]